MKFAKTALLLGLIFTALAMAGCGKKEPELYMKMTAPEASSDLKYADPEFGLSFTFIPSYMEMQIHITNTSPDMIKIIWDNCVFVDFDGQPGRVIHYGIQYIDKEKSLVPTLIPPGLTLKEGIMPSSRIRFGSNSWLVSPLVSSPKKAVGQTLGFIMCFQKNNVRQKYIDFKFEIISPQKGAFNGLNPVQNPGAAFAPDSMPGTPIIPVFELPNSEKKDGRFEASQAH